MATAVTPFMRAPDVVAGGRRAGDRAPGHVGPVHLDDSALVAAVAAGDATALDQLYIRYRPVAFAVAYALLRDPGAAEDAVHDAFLSVWRAAPAFQLERGSPRAWLIAIVRNRALDGLRARQLAQRQATMALSEVSAQSEEDVCATVAMAADARRLRAALKTLPSSQRHAVELAFFAGLTHGEIADRTGVPLGTAKGRVRLGLRRLRLNLSELAPDARGQPQLQLGSP